MNHQGFCDPWKSLVTQAKLTNIFLSTFFFGFVPSHQPIIPSIVTEGLCGGPHLTLGQYKPSHSTSSSSSSSSSCSSWLFCVVLIVGTLSLKLSDVSLLLGRAVLRRRDYDGALMCGEQALATARKRNDQLTRMLACRELGDIQRFRGDYPEVSNRLFLMAGSFNNNLPVFVLLSAIFFSSFLFCFLIGRQVL